MRRERRSEGMREEARLERDGAERGGYTGLEKVDVVEERCGEINVSSRLQYPSCPIPRALSIFD